MPWLTALAVKPSSSAALVKLSCRAAASNSRSGGSGGIGIGIAASLHG
jgi:hypothetical protein